MLNGMIIFVDHLWRMDGLITYAKVIKKMIMGMVSTFSLCTGTCTKMIMCERVVEG